MNTIIASQPDSTISANAFLAHLREIPEKRLVFQDSNGRQIPGGYHVTEIKAVQYQTMDCGGQGNQWQEIILQVMHPSIDTGSEHMQIKKFLKIYDQVASKVLMDINNELKIEYGDHQSPAIHAFVNHFTLESDVVIAHLRPQTVRCKARDRQASDGGACGSNTASLTEPAQNASACCTPNAGSSSKAESGCC